jgi:hypothetical protein
VQKCRDVRPLTLSGSLKNGFALAEKAVLLIALYDEKKITTCANILPHSGSLPSEKILMECVLGDPAAVLPPVAQTPVLPENCFLELAKGFEPPTL